jgi:hypothetical protein
VIKLEAPAEEIDELGGVIGESLALEQGFEGYIPF